jgi:hypothetical protein
LIAILVPYYHIGPLSASRAAFNFRLILGVPRRLVVKYGLMMWVAPLLLMAMPAIKVDVKGAVEGQARLSARFTGSLLLEVGRM